ncbi:Serine carboxypeptidase 3 [Diatrype stigma]|uniref:3-oxoacyl-[acyl-carrier-protein] synthase, mitochondrial n=1 Tax=Diatrype stigma TaxID=117547 RepID=A0AAN9UUH6_9PEZI
MRRVVVTGLGAITPLGVGVRRTWSRLLAGQSGIVSTAGYEPHQRWSDLTSKVAGIVPKDGTGDGFWRPGDWLSATEQRRMSLFSQYAIAATEMALEDAGWKPGGDQTDALESTGVCLGSGIGNLDEIYATSLAFEKDGYKKVSPLFVPQILTNMAAGHISMKHGFQGPNHAVTTACTTGAHSIGDASRFIAFGDADVMVAGGSESCIHPLTFAGFGRSRSLSTAFNGDPAASCRPFDRRRSGFVVAEGAAVLVLEELAHARARGARIYAELRGYGTSGDAHHMTAPRADGSGAFLAMRRALKHGGIKPGQVDYINAHATATTVGDAAEASAIRSLMCGEEGYADEGQVTASSTKGSIGHLLGAAGAIEALFAVMAITENAVPPTLNLHDPDIQPKFNLVPLEAQQKEVKVAMSNSFGFGGTNASLVFSEQAEPYRILHATEAIYKACAKDAGYRIDPAHIKAGTIPKTPEGEHIGVGEGTWHTDFKLPPTFSTWSQVTMLHMYLVYARLRKLEAEAARSWQKQLTDHFFFDAEDRMELSHGLSSRGLRHRYLKDLFVQWRGVLVAYDEGVVRGDPALAAAVWRNVFKARPDVDARAVAAIVSWMRLCLKMLDQMPDEALVSHAQSTFKWPARNELATVDIPVRELRGQVAPPAAVPPPPTPSPPSPQSRPRVAPVKKAAAV